MSYIHEALKKAQVERDLGKTSQGGIPIPHRKKAFFTGRKAAFLAALLLLLLLAFAGYSWWDSKSRIPDVAPPTITGSPDTRGVASKNKGAITPRQDRSAGPPDKGRTVPDPSKTAGTSRPGTAAPSGSDRRQEVADAYEKARGFHRGGRLADAAGWYEKVIFLDPGHVQALNNRGVLYLHDRAYSSARKYFEKAIRLKRDYVDPYYNLACVSAALGQTDRGLRYLQKAVSLNPDVKKWALEDPDLDPLRGAPQFNDIVTK